MCCFTDQGVECEFRVILHRDKIYPIEGSHSHHVANENIVDDITNNVAEDESNKFLVFKEDIKQRLQHALLKKTNKK